MPNRDLVVIGGSAGAIDPLRDLIGALPADLPASIFVVQHVSPHAPSMLPAILAAVTKLEVVPARDGDPIKPGHVYVAQPGRHLLVESSQVRVVHGPKENRHRPAIDTLFRSAAWHFRSRVIGIVLSGSLDDGTAGLWAVKRSGGLAVVQDPAEATFPDMPANAMRQVAIDHVLHLREIPPLLERLTRERVDGNGAKPPDDHRLEVESILGAGDIDMSSIGTRSGFGCPACGGGLWELNEEGIVRFRCHVGHAYSEQSLVADQSESVDQALESARRIMKEHAGMMRRLIDRLGDRSPGLSGHYADRLHELEAQCAVLGTLQGNEPRSLSGSGRTPGS
jgi:two-component system chemotaxis response regulator CheB